MNYLQVSSDPYINSFRTRMKLKKIEYNDDVKKLLIEWKQKFSFLLNFNVTVIFSWNILNDIKITVISDFKVVPKIFQKNGRFYVVGVWGVEVIVGQISKLIFSENICSNITFMYTKI